MMSRGAPLCLSVVCLPVLLGWAGTAPAPAAVAPVGEIIPRRALFLPCVGAMGRRPLVTNPILAAWARGTPWLPKAGDKITGTNGQAVTWESLDATPDGTFENPRLRGGFLLIMVRRPQAGVLMLEAQGHQLVLVNDEPRAGDAQGCTTVRLPIYLKEGDNHLLFLLSHCSPRLRTRLTPPPGEVFLHTEDQTLAHAVQGQPYRAWGAVPVVNATTQTFHGLTVAVSPRRGETLATKLPPLPPLSIRKVPFEVEAPVPPRARRLSFTLTLQEEKPGGIRDLLRVETDVVRPTQPRLLTFRSHIDGSVQQYAHLPPATFMGPQRDLPGVLFTLHGAGTDAWTHLNHYQPKPWCHLVAPTNRRPYGFDWEDWGRLDALEVLEQVRHRDDLDPRRIWLTGHSMGGHGTWHLGTLYPDRFAGLAPSAGWVSMFTYAGMKWEKEPTPLVEMLQRGALPSDTLTLAENLHRQAIYVLHGSHDANVPVQQARKMREVLGKYAPHFHYHEQPGAGHWWGTECVDCQHLLDFLRHQRCPDPATVAQVHFVTASPGVSASCSWATVEAQEKPWQLSSIHLQRDLSQHRIQGTTKNVSRLSLDLQHLPPGAPVHINLDGQKLPPIPWPVEKRLWLGRNAGQWAVIAKPALSQKGPHRYGGFKDVFRHRFCLVYGTRGTPAENAWSLAQARYLAEVFWLRGNGSVDVLPDQEFDPAAEPDRNVVLLGNADTNAAWPPLLGSCPVQFRRGLVKCGAKEWHGDNLGGLFLHPRPGSDTACVGVLGSTGLPGLRSISFLPLFVSGTPFPDCLIVDTKMLTDGLAGVRCAGYFGPDWQVKTGEFVMP